MKTALVTGANGFVGSAVCRDLLEHGYRVLAMQRPKSDLSLLEGLAVEPVIADICDRASLDRVMSGVDVVFHIAALFREAKFADEVYFEVNVEGTRNVFESAIAHGVKRIVHCSTNGVHSHIVNPPANEEEPFRPGDVYQQSKAEGELLAKKYFDSGKISGNIIRPGMIWGPGDKRFLKLFRGIAKQRMPLIGNGKVLTHWVLVSDLAAAFRLAAETESVNGEAFLIAGERTLPLLEVYNKIGQYFKVKAPRFRFPAWPVQLIGSLVELICAPFGIEPPIHRRRADFFIKQRAFDISKAKRLLGYQPAQSFEAEVKTIGDWYVQKGWI